MLGFPVLPRPVPASSCFSPHFLSQIGWGTSCEGAEGAWLGSNSRPSPCSGTGRRRGDTEETELSACKCGMSPCTRNHPRKRLPSKSRFHFHTAALILMVAQLSHPTATVLLTGHGPSPSPSHRPERMQATSRCPRMTSRLYSF